MLCTTATKTSNTIRTQTVQQLCTVMMHTNMSSPLFACWLDWLEERI